MRGEYDLIDVRAFVFTIVLLSGLAGLTGGAAVGGTQNGSEAVRTQVRTNILNQRIGSHTVADLHLPDEFLDRITDRIIRASYEQRFRIVMRDDPKGASAVTPAAVSNGSEPEQSQQSDSRAVKAQVDQVPVGAWAITMFAALGIILGLYSIMRKLTGGARTAGARRR